MSEYEQGRDAFKNGTGTTNLNTNQFSGWMSEALKVQQQTLNSALPTTPWPSSSSSSSNGSSS